MISRGSRVAVATFGVGIAFASAAAPSHALLGGLTQSLTTALQQTTQTVQQTVGQTTTSATGTVEQAAGGNTIGAVTTLVGGTAQATTGTINTVTGAVTNVDGAVDVLASGLTDPIGAPYEREASTLPSDFSLVPNALGSVVAELGANVLCPTVTFVDDLGRSVSAVGTLTTPITEPLVTVACNLELLQFDFFTRAAQADGPEIVRTQSALVGVPTPLNVDSDPSADLVGTITLVDANTIGLVVERAAGETGELPVSVEAVINDPERKLFPRQRLAFGYDATDDRAPGRWTATVPLQTLLGSGLDGQVQIATEQEDRGERIALLGGLFDGTASDRARPLSVRVGYGASPDRSTVAAALSGDTSVRLTQNRRGPTTLDATLEEDETTRVAATVADIPTDLTLAARTAGEIAVAYRAAETVDTLRATVTTSAAGDVRSTAVLRADDLPTGIDLALDGSDTGTVTTQGGPVGVLEVGTANGPDVRFLDPATDPAHVNVDDDGTTTSTAARLLGVESVTFGLGTPVALTARWAPGPFRARIATPDSTLDARVEDLPGDFALTADLASGAITYDGRGSGIETIRIDADGTTPVIGRATTLKARIAGVPAEMQLAIDTDGDVPAVTVGGSGALGRIELQATDGDLADAPLPPADEMGALVKDRTDGAYAIAARLLDLRRISASLDPATGVALDASTRGGPFALAVDTDALRANARIADLPAEVTLGVDLADSVIRVDGSTPIGLLSLDIDAAEPLLLGANAIAAKLTDIPAQVELTLDVENTRIASSAPIGIIDLVATSEGATPASIPDGEAGAILRVGETETAVAVRLFKLREIAVSLDPVQLAIRHEGGRPFTLGALLDGTEADGRIENAPDDLTLGFSPETGLSYEASAAVERITLAINGIELFPGAAGVEADIRDVPLKFALNLPETGPFAVLSVPDGAEIGQLRLGAGKPLPTDGDGSPRANDVLQVTQTSEEFGAGIQLTSIKGLEVGLDPIGLQFALGENRRTIELDATLETAPGVTGTVTGAFVDPPEALNLQVQPPTEADPEGGVTASPAQVLYGASGPMPQLALNAQGLLGDGVLEATLDNMPTQLRLCLDTGPLCQRDNTGARITASTTGVSAADGGNYRGDRVNGRPNPAEVSIDFDDMGTSPAGAPVVMNGRLTLDPAQPPVVISDLRFHNWSFDFGQGPTVGTLAGQVPRVWMFMDSRSHRFSIGNLSYPGVVDEFKIGTAASPARANKRIAWIRGATLGFPATSSAGQMECGGNRVLRYGGINLLNVALGISLFPLCGGTPPANLP